MFMKDKINETIKEHDYNMQAMSNFEHLSISPNNESVQSIISDTSAEGSGDDSCKPYSKK
eukprot:11945452-Ditylum_brightwellii.AAC.1